MRLGFVHRIRYFTIGELPVALGGRHEICTLRLRKLLALRRFTTPGLLMSGGGVVG